MRSALGRHLVDGEDVSATNSPVSLGSMTCFLLTAARTCTAPVLPGNAKPAASGHPMELWRCSKRALEHEERFDEGKGRSDLRHVVPLHGGVPRRLLTERQE